MNERKLGRDGPSVFPIGLGCMSIGIADVYTSSVQSDEQAVALIHRALDLGVTLLDTADIYGASEQQVGKALQAQLALAWLLSRHNNVIPIPGTSSAKRLEENVGAAHIALSEDELARIDQIAPRGAAAGARYNEAMGRLLNG